ncbi:protein unc-93 homolog B1 [Eudromia elegans]
MEKDPGGCAEATEAAGGSERGHVGMEAQLDDFVGARGDYDEEEEERKYFRRRRLGVVKNVVAASAAAALTYGVYLGLLQMQLILHYDETYREVKYSSMALGDVDRKVLTGLHVTPVAALLYTPVLMRFLGTKWTMFVATGVYALFVSSNYWERYYTLVPAAVAVGAAVVPFWASLGTYVTRMAHKYYEYAHYEEEHVQEQRRAPRGAAGPYVVLFQSLFYGCFHLSFVGAQMPMLFFLNGYLYGLNHTLAGVKRCGTLSNGTLAGFNTTVLQSLPRSASLIVVESALMAAAFAAMLLVLLLCGPAYRPMEEIDLRSIGWGNIFQLPFKHMRDYRLRHLLPFFAYSGFEGLFACTGFSLDYGVCALGLERLGALLAAYGASASAGSALALGALRLRRRAPLLAGALLHGALLAALFCWAPAPRAPAQAPPLYALAALWGLGSALNKAGISIVLGQLYEDKERQDFVFTVYHWWQALAVFVLYLSQGLPMKAKLAALLLLLVVAAGAYGCMEHKVARRVAHRLPRIPRPRRKVRGYRYLEDDASDATGSDDDDGGDGDNGATEPPAEAARPCGGGRARPARAEPQ